MNGILSLKTNKFAADFEPIEEGCDCSTCKNYTRSYIHLLISSKETVGCHLVSVHNVAFQLRLMNGLRNAIIEDRFPDQVKQFFASYFGDKSKYPEWAVAALKSVNIDLLS